VVIRRGTALPGPSAYLRLHHRRALMVEPSSEPCRKSGTSPCSSGLRGPHPERPGGPVPQRQGHHQRLLHPRLRHRSQGDVPKNTPPTTKRAPALAEPSWPFAKQGHHLPKSPACRCSGGPESTFQRTEEPAPCERRPSAARASWASGGDEWHCSACWGLVQPEGVKATLELDWYDNGGPLPHRPELRPETYQRYNIYGLLDQERKDDSARRTRTSRPRGPAGVAGNATSSSCQRLGTPVRVELHLRPQLHGGVSSPTSISPARTRRPSCTQAAAGQPGPHRACFSTA